MIKKSHIIILAVLLVVIVVEGYFYYKTLKYRKEPVPDAVSFEEVIDASTVSSLYVKKAETPKTVAKVEIPAELNLQAVFYSQAPFGNWDYPWQEACEEAVVLLIANEYFGHNWTREQFNEQILALVEWEKSTFGQYEHTNVEESARILKEYLNLDYKVHDNPTYKDVQEVLARGHLIFMPFAGKTLGNPFYTNGGPVYHAMLIKGYKEGEKIITHDVGTKRGEDYVYSWAVIENSLHDYAEPISLGSKKMIEVIPPIANNF